MERSPPLTTAQSRIAMVHLRARFDPVQGAAQWDGVRRAELVRAVNAELEAAGEPPVYTRKKLGSWIEHAHRRARSFPCPAPKRARSQPPTLGPAPSNTPLARPLGEGRAQRGSRPAPPLDDGAQHEYTVCAEGPGKRAAAGGGTQVRAARLGVSLAEEAGA